MLIKKLFLCLILVIFILILPANIFSQNITQASRINWKDGTIIFDISMDISQRKEVLPVIRSSGERFVRQQLPDYLRETLFVLPADSYYTIKDSALADGRILDSIKDAGALAKKMQSIISPDFKTLNIRYKYMIYPDIISIFTNHNRVIRNKTLLSYVPTADFTGIVIYVKGSYPYHGERGLTEFSPSFHPSVYNEQMELLISSEMVNPEIFINWGSVKYTDSADEADCIDRIGHSPLRIRAAEIFGKNKTDIIIPDEDALKILYNNNNLDLIHNGRILIICDLN